MAVAELERVSRSFGAKEVLRDLNLVVGAGDRVAVRGSNGSGKTTLVRCVAGTLVPSAGSITIGGSPAGTSAARAQLGVALSQGRGLYGRLTGWQNLQLFARLRFGKQESKLAVTAVARELELERILPVRGDRCSAGMLAQVALARALLGEPLLLLLDEPTRSMDEGARDRLWAAVERRPQVALLIASHREEDFARCTRTITLDGSSV
jgi:ABC-type multidrug transport system ATPase subunit